MNPNSAKALVNGAKRPLKTSKLNPYVMRPARDGVHEVRISPRIDALNAQWQAGRLRVPAPGVRGLHTVAEDKANYVPGTRADARAAAADMLRRYRKTNVLSANMNLVTRLTSINDALTEFAHPVMQYVDDVQQAPALEG